MKKLFVFFLISLFCFAYGAGNIRVEGDSYTTISTLDGLLDGYKVNSYFENGYKPIFDSYVVLGEDDEYQSQEHNIGARAIYTLTGLPSTNIDVYSTIEFKLVWFTSDIELKSFPIDESDESYSLSVSAYGGLSTMTLIENDVNKELTSNMQVIGEDLQSLGSGAKLTYQLESYDEIAIDYLEVNYSIKGRLELDSTNIPSLAARTGTEEYKIYITNTGDTDKKLDINCSETWISAWSDKVDISAGYSAVINVKLDPNDNTEIRTGTITLGNAPFEDIVITVSQERDLLNSDLSITYLPIPSTIPYDGGTYQIKVLNTGEKDLSWNTRAIPDWITATPASGTGLDNASQDTVILQVSQNNSGVTRTATIEFYNSDIEGDVEEVSFSQEPWPTSSIRGKVSAMGSSTGIKDIEIIISGQTDTSVYTGTDGIYRLTELPYGEYTVIPVKDGHDFSPDSLVITLGESEQVVNFEDQTVIEIGGKISFLDYDCPVKNVTILKGLEDIGWRTDSSGVWSGTVLIGEAFYLVPQFSGYDFTPDRLPAIGDTLLFENYRNFNFSVTTTYTLAINTQNSSGDPISGIDVIYKTLCNCIPETTIITDTAGIVLDLPPLTYQIAIYSPEYVGWFPENDITLTLMKDTSVTFTPVTDLVINIADIPVVYNSDETDSVYSIHQYDSALLDIQVNDTEGCPAKYVSFKVIDDVADRSSENIVITTDDNGKAAYWLKGGQPAFHYPEDHTKQITFSAQTDPFTVNDKNTKTFSIVVTGEELIDSSFVTGLPEIPIKILHDPSGDNSFSFFQEESKISQSVGLAIETGLGTELKAKVGFKLFGFGSSIEGAIATSLATRNGQTCEITMNEKDLKTSSKIFDNSSSIGPGKGDVYVGLGMNILYGRGKEVILVDAVPVLDTSIFWQPSYNPTTYMYTANYIENTILKQDCDLLELYDNEDWLYEARDTRQRWEDVLHMNIGYDNKITPDEEGLVNYIDAISFNGGSSNTHEYTVSRTSTNTISTTVKFNETIAAWLKTGALETTFTLNISIGETQTQSSSETITETIGYTLYDNDEWDVFNIKCYEDLVFGTLLFISENSSSSNPWEKQTSSVLGVSLSPAGDIYTTLRTNEKAGFSAMVSNLNTKATAPGSYRIYVPSNLNPTHVKVKINSKDEDILSVPFNGNTSVGISAEYDISTYGDTSVFAVVAQASGDFQVADTVYYTIVWSYVVPPVEFMTGKDPYDNDIRDSLLNVSEPVYIWGECTSSDDPDSVLLYSRLKGNYIWNKEGIMTEYHPEGSSHSYYRYEYFADSDTDTCTMEFELTAYKNEEYHNSKSRHSIYICPGPESAINPGHPIELPKTFALEQNYPNPFNPRTMIDYALPVPGNVEICVFDLNGRKISTLVSEMKDAGFHSIEWNAADFTSGIYIYRLTAISHSGTANESYVQTGKMILMK